MDVGNIVRERSRAGEILALWAIAQIKERRAAEGPVLRRTAHILRSIKHPDEARALRAVYGPGFFLIALSASTNQKLWHLKQKGLPEEEARKLIERDAGEENDFGQKTREAFDLADVYIRQEPEHVKTTAQLERFLRLVFGAIDETPTKDEHAMFLAYASSLRSADLSRQVGAVVWRDSVGVVATGCNDVPAPGGGLYWTGPGDQRDHVKGHDANERHRREIAEQVARRVLDELGLDAEKLTLIRDACGKTRLLDITEFGRAVHAEMDALLSCGRGGIETAGTTLFSTTFPCHNCAKHIVAAGVTRVVYIEPYQKSQALDLHDDAIAVDDHGDPGRRLREAEAPRAKVIFESFVGVGPRRYFDLFSDEAQQRIRDEAEGGWQEGDMDRERRGRRASSDVADVLSRARGTARPIGDGAYGGDAMKIKIRIDDPQTRAVWEAAQKAKAEVESWPAWKRGEEVSGTETEATQHPGAEGPRRSGS
jgi:deoxycytidylate deaminase